MARKDLIKSHVNTFLQQESDHEWLIKKCVDGIGRDEFKNTIVYSTFPVSLNRDDFAYYIDMTFSDISEELRKRIQILAQKNDQNELEILFGFISLTRKPSIGFHFNADYWKSDKQKVQRGLQYIFGNQAQKEIAHR